LVWKVVEGFGCWCLAKIGDTGAQLGVAHTRYRAPCLHPYESRGLALFAPGSVPRGWRASSAWHYLEVRSAPLGRAAGSEAVGRVLAPSRGSSLSTHDARCGCRQQRNALTLRDRKVAPHDRDASKAM